MTASRYGIPRLAHGLCALAVLLAVVVGVPALLTALGFIPAAVPSLGQLTTAATSRDDGQLAVTVIAVGAWVCWALFTASLIAEVAALVGGRPARRLPGLTGFQRPAAALLTAALFGLTALPAASGATTASAEPVPQLPALAAHPAAASYTGPPQATASVPAAGRATPPSSLQTSTRLEPPAPTYRVQRRDSLWRIAERHLGNPLRYPDIVTLNPGVVGPDNTITAGSVLLMPSDATRLPAATASAPVSTDFEVKAGDTLWGIEEEITGSGNNWQQGWQANRGRAEPGGATFTDPSLIRPGWTLSIPTPATAQAETPPYPPTPPAHHAAAPARDAPSRRTSTPAADAKPNRVFEVTRPPAAAPSAPADSANAPMVAFAAGGGLLLAGVSLTALAGYRRRQFRRRNPGRTIAGSPPELAGVEQTLQSAGSIGVDDVTFLDQAVRSLVHRLAGVAAARLPDVVAACLTAESLTLVLAGPAGQPPHPWTADPSGTRWSVRRADPLGYRDDKRAFCFAPYPTLVCVGYTAGGDQWLLDLERVGAMSLSGDTERCLNLARFLAAELAHNSWSEMLRVTVVGLGAELTGLNPDRLTHTDDLAAAITACGGQLKLATDAMDAAGIDLLAGRLHDVAGDLWAPRVLLVGAQQVADSAGLDRLLRAIGQRPGRTPVGVVLADSPASAPAARWQLTVDGAGILRIPALDLELIAQQIPVGEAAQLAQLLAATADAKDQPVPPARGDQPWDAHADACGGLTAGTTPASQPGEPPAGPAVLHLADRSLAANSLLPLSPQTYLEGAATTEQDVQALAPAIDEDVRAQVERADPGLDIDLAAWSDPDCPRPRLTLLGPISVRAQGRLPERNPRLAFHTEIVAYLATRTSGVLSDRYAAAIWPNEADVVGKTKVRQSVTTVRAWLGRDPGTGQEYLPSGLHEAGAARYRINGILTDAELFRRLRIRGAARGADGIADLRRALDLVTGPPFDDLPVTRQGAPGGYGWLVDAGSRLDHEYSAMIVDVAHTVATHHLGAGESRLAAAAAQVALSAGSYEDVPLLDLVKASLAQDNQAEAETYVQRILSNHDAEVEEDLPPRTAQVLFRLRRQWVN